MAIRGGNTRLAWRTTVAVKCLGCDATTDRTPRDEGFVPCRHCGGALVRVDDHPRSRAAMRRAFARTEIARQEGR